MFDLTEAEKDSLERAKALEAAHQEKTQAFRRLGYQATDEDRATAQREVAEVKEALETLATDETFMLATLKLEANKAIGEKLPGGSYPALLAFAEQTLGLLDTENGKRTTDLLRSVVLRLMAAGADREIQLARARFTKVRYDSLVEVGLPEELVRQIIVAEASRPWPMPNASASGSRR